MNRMRRNQRPTRARVSQVNNYYRKRRFKRSMYYVLRALLTNDVLRDVKLSTRRTRPKTEGSIIRFANEMRIRSYKFYGDLQGATRHAV